MLLFKPVYTLIHVTVYPKDLALYRDPASIFYNRPEMRKYRLRSLQRGNLEPFSNSSKRSKAGKSITHCTQLYCHYQHTVSGSTKKCERIIALVFEAEAIVKERTYGNLRKCF